MAAQPFEKIKPRVLMAFLVVNVILVFLIWGENLAGPVAGSGGFVRSTPEATRQQPAALSSPTSKPTAGTTGTGPSDAHNDEAPAKAPAKAETATPKPPAGLPTASATPELSEAIQDK